MVYVLVQQKVRDFEEWSKVYEKNEMRWRTAGMELLYMFRSADEGNRVTLLYKVQDIILMHVHFQSSQFIERLLLEGIITAFKHEVLEAEPVGLLQNTAP